MGRGLGHWVELSGEVMHRPLAYFCLGQRAGSSRSVALRPQPHAAAVLQAGVCATIMGGE